MSKINWFFGREAPPDEESPNESVTISADQLVIYGREVAELQRVLTKRNATIGRLRAANRELRRELHSLEKQKQMHAIQQEIAEASKTTLLPTVPPRVGGVYRTRRGEAIKITGKSDSMRHPFFGRTETDGRALSFTSNGYYLGHGEPDSCDLVAEISPPPEPAFTGPLEVGGWYEDEEGRAWFCNAAHWSEKLTAVQFFCLGDDGGSQYFYKDGQELPCVTSASRGARIIRKVDTPGGES